VHIAKSAILLLRASALTAKALNFTAKANKAKKEGGKFCILYSKSLFSFCALAVKFQEFAGQV
jgi:hypothetical protein